MEKYTELYFSINSAALCYCSKLLIKEILECIFFVHSNMLNNTLLTLLLLKKADPIEKINSKRFGLYV